MDNPGYRNAFKLGEGLAIFLTTVVGIGADEILPKSWAIGITIVVGLATLFIFWINHRIQEIERSIVLDTKWIVRSSVLSLLNALHDAIIVGQSDGAWNQHRVTLFKAVPCEGKTANFKRLEIYARSGLHDLTSKTCWEIDTNDPDQKCGVAGKLWFLEDAHGYSAEGEWSDDDEEAQEIYVRNLFMTVPQAKKLNVRSGSFYGMLLRVADEKWGILLIDSLNRDFSLTNYKTPIVDAVAKGIATIIRRTT